MGSHGAGGPLSFEETATDSRSGLMRLSAVSRRPSTVAALPSALGVEGTAFLCPGGGRAGGAFEQLPVVSPTVMARIANLFRTTPDSTQTSVSRRLAVSTCTLSGARIQRTLIHPLKCASVGRGAPRACSGWRFIRLSDGWPMPGRDRVRRLRPRRRVGGEELARRR